MWTPPTVRAGGINAAGGWVSGGATGAWQVDDNATPTMYNSLMYKLSYYRFNVRL